MLTSVYIFVVTLVFSLILGLIVAFGRMSKNIILRSIIKVYISIMRGTPLILQIMFIYFSPYYIFKIQISPEYKIYAVFISFIINYAAYFAEIYRGGIESMPVGQYEAAKVLGYNKVQTFFKIIFPQMVKRVMPPVTNEVITLVKDTSLAFALAYTEMFTLAKQIAAANTSIMPLFIAGIFYYVFNFIAWTLLMVLFGVPVNEFEYLLSFLDTLPGSSCLTQVIVYACSLVIILSQFIAYQIWFSCIYIVFSLPICFYWPLVNKVIGWWIENVYMAAPEGRDD